MKSTSNTLVPVVLTGMARSGTTYFGELANRYLDYCRSQRGNLRVLARQTRLSRPEVLQNDSALRTLLRGFADHLYFHFLYKNAHNVDRVANDLFPLIEERSRARALHWLP